VSEGILEQWQHPHWNSHFLSPLSVAICNDFFWYFFLQELALARVQLGDPVAAASQAKLEPSQQHIRAQEVMFRRVSDHYMELFWKVGLTMHTDEFFDRYPEALCSTIHLAFESGLPDSAYQFGDVEFQGRLKDIFGRWSTGLQPRRLRSELKLSRPEDDMPSYSTPGPARTKTSKRNYGFFNAVGHSPMVASYMDRHGLKCQIGGTESRHPVAVHRLRRLEVAMNKDPVKWRKKRRTPLKVAPRINAATKPKATSSAHMMTSVMPQIHSTCGMGTFSQKKVDEEFLKYLFPYG